jgi:hypothetical protein
MYNVLIKLIVVASLLELGLSFKNFGECSSRSCWSQFHRASHKVLRIDWKPISVFPEVGKKFR